MPQSVIQHSVKQGVSGRLAAFFLESRITPLLAIVAFLLGVFATLVTPREEEPQIDVTMVDVMVPFTGASAKDVENLITRPAEQVFSRMHGIEHIYSMSRPGMAIISVQFNVGVKYNDAVLRLHDTVMAHKDWLSPNLGVSEPIIKPRGIDDVPIVSLTLWTRDTDRSAYELQQVARALEIELKRIKGTRDISTLGGPNHAIRILMDTARMNAFQLTPQDIVGALKASNGLQSSGNLTNGNHEILIQTGSYLESVADVKRIVVAVRDGKPVFVQDIATIEDGPDQPKRYAWLGNPDGEFPAVTLQLSKQPGVNAADIASAAIRQVESLKNTVIPEGIEVTVTRNYGETATEKAQKLIGKLIFATAFVVALVFFALGKREAIIVGLAVTLTLASTLFASWAWGFTLNRVSLFALIFSIGILVDDAIVVVENIHRWQNLYPEKTLFELIPGAVDEVGGPTILATLTVIAALLPMAFVSGLMGPYMSPIPINSSLGMAISLAIAFIITPWLCLKLMRSHAPEEGQPSGHTSASALDNTLDNKLDRIFRRLLTPYLDAQTGNKARKKLAIAIVLLIVGSLSLTYFQWVVLKMLPFDNKSEFQIVLDLPVGTPLEETARVLHEIGTELSTEPDVANYQAYAGTSSPINFNGLVRQYYLRASPEKGDIQVNLKDKHQRTRKSHDIATSLRERIEAIGKRYGGVAKVVEVPPGPPVMSPIVAEVYGPDYNGQIRVGKHIRQAFESTPDIVAIDDYIDADARKFALHVLQSKAAQLGVSQQDIIDVVGIGLSGLDITPIHNQESRFEIPIRLSLPPEKLSSLDALLQLRVKSRNGALIPVSELVNVRETLREKAIYHKDLLPVVYVIGDMGGKLDSPLYGMFDIRRKINGLSLEEGGTLGEWFIRQPTDPYTGYSVKWDGEWQVTYETFRDMGIAYAVGLILIYLLVVAHFGSYVIPLIIMAPIPLTIIGVMPGHALFGAQFTATSMIGMIALAGIIVRNSILLVDFIGQQVANGMALHDAVIQSAAVRAKPIALTALAAMLGALFILDDPIFNGLALSLIFGILVSTLLTLVVIPVLYFATFHTSGEHQP